MDRNTEDIVTFQSTIVYPSTEGDTVAEAGPTMVDRAVTPRDAKTGAGEPDEELTKSRAASIAQGALARFHIKKLIGRGGMGDVFSAFDEQIGRSVAVKRLRMHGPPASSVARFMREARIQARLEHPAVVPVHAVSLAQDPFFVMKQLVGVTLADVLDAPHEHPGFARQRLLRAFAEVCLAVEFAHTRGIVHRDLKPANIMLGDFGEVYVLDWGIARIVGDDGEFADVIAAAEPGTVVGTPGYMSPEQVRGETADARADVYALGCILFEILAGRPLHPRGLAALAFTLTGSDARPSHAAPDRDIPPELDAACVAATALDRDERIHSARALGDAVQRFLDGDRDLSLRRELAQRELAVAQRAFADGSGPEHHAAAIRAAARALALDPHGRDAAGLLGRLMLEAPAETPREAEREIEARDREAMSLQARLGSWALASYLIFYPLLYWAGFRELWFHIAGLSGASITLICARILVRRPSSVTLALSMVTNALLIAFFSRCLTPFLVAPCLGALTATWFAIHPRGGRTWVVALTMIAGVLGPWCLELAGVLSPTSVIDGNRLILTTHAASQMDPLVTFGALALFTASMVATVTVLTRQQAGSRYRAERLLQLHAWRLRQLVLPAPAVPAATLQATRR